MKMLEAILSTKKDMLVLIRVHQEIHLVPEKDLRVVWSSEKRSLKLELTFHLFPSECCNSTPTTYVQGATPHLLSSLPLQLKSLFCVKEEINERMGKFWTWDRFSICYMNAPGICWQSFSRNVLRRTATNVSIKSKWKEERVTIFWKKGSSVFEMNLQMSKPFVSFAFIYFLVKHALSPLPPFILCC